MDKVNEAPHEESAALNSIVNSVRAQGLNAHRRRVTLRWKKNECVRMKSQIADIQVEMTRLLRKNRKLDAFLSAKETSKKFHADASMNFLVSSMKLQCLERKNNLDETRKEMTEFVGKHKKAWDKVNDAVSKSRRMAEVEELKKGIAALKEEIEQTSKENEVKRIAAMKDAETSTKAIVEFAEMMVLRKKIEDLSVQEKEIREKIRQKKKQAARAVEPVNNQALAVLDFEMFDSEMNEADPEQMIQEPIDVDFDFNCTVLSLEASIDQYKFTGSSLGVPVDASTPIGSELNQAVLEEAEDEAEENDDNREQRDLEQQPPQVLESPKSVETEETMDSTNDQGVNVSEDIDYRAKYAKSPENLPISAATSPQPAAQTPAFNFINSVQEAAGASLSLFGFGSTEPKTSSIFNLF